MERRLQHTDVVIVCCRRSVHWYPRGGGGLSTGVKISARRRQISSAASTLEVAAATEDSNKGDGHPNDSSCPMGGRGLEI
jgi:hypothetical protein